MIRGGKYLPAGHSQGKGEALGISDHSPVAGENTTGSRTFPGQSGHPAAAASRGCCHPSPTSPPTSLGARPRHTLASRTCGWPSPGSLFPGVTPKSSPTACSCLCGPASGFQHPPPPWDGWTFWKCCREHPEEVWQMWSVNQTSLASSQGWWRHTCGSSRLASILDTAESKPLIHREGNYDTGDDLWLKQRQTRGRDALARVQGAP